MDFIAGLIRSLFLAFMLLVIAPTILFLTKSYYANLIAKKTYIGVIDLPQVINRSDDIISAAKNLFSSSEIRALILVCNSKGGNPGVCFSIQSDLLRLKELYQKPIIAFIEKECIDGAYGIATSADYIVASPSSIISNVGKFDSNDENSLLKYNEKINEDIENQYFELLKSHRPKISEKSLNDIKNGMITGVQAKNLNFVDYCGGRLEVERILRGKTVIEGKTEEVRGSLGEHFIFYISNIFHKIIKRIK